MASHVTTVAFQGIDAVPVDVQVQMSPGTVHFAIVGLPDKAVAESRERVRAALMSTGLALPAKRIIVNLAPADLPKEGSHYDLPIALGIMMAMGVLPADQIADFVVLGELALDGTLTSVAGVLPAAIGANSLDKGLICPQACGPEAAWADPDMEILNPHNLISIANHFKGTQSLTRPAARLSPAAKTMADLSDIKGQETAKRVLEIAAAGGHNMLMVGPPGAGKSMLAARMSSILPPLLSNELLEVSMIASLCSGLQEGKLSAVRPFRAPHHSASMAAMVGGGIRAQPGEISRAHNGVLFLDELPEFAPQVLDSLRQPLETGQASIVRANYRANYPARVQLIAAMNPCRCGMLGEPGHVCRRGPRCATDYQARISGPFLDRIDLRIDVPAVKASDLIGAGPSEPSSIVFERVKAARAIQQNRYAELGLPFATNASAPASLIEDIVASSSELQSLLRDAAEKLLLSARGYHRVLKVARTLADLDGSRDVERNHISEALAYRTAHTLLA